MTAQLIRRIAVTFVFIASLLLAAPMAVADIIGQDQGPGEVVEGTVKYLEYDENGRLVVAIIVDGKGNRFFLFDGNADDDMNDYGRALELAFGSGAKVKLHVQSTPNGEDVTSLELRKKGGKAVDTGA